VFWSAASGTAQLRDFEGHPTPSDPAVPIGILRQALLVIVGAEANSRTEATELRSGHPSTGRLSVDADVDPKIDVSGLLVPSLHAQNL
jgi:hypothetical protein